MLRQVPTCKGGRFKGVLKSVGAVVRDFSVSANALQERVNGWNESKEIDDVHTLFRYCTNLQSAKCLHARLVVSESIRNVCISAKLVNHYCYLGNVALARHTFDHIENRDVYAWNSMISGYSRAGDSSGVIRCFSLFMSSSGLGPDYRTFPSVLKACRNVIDGDKIHCLALKFGFLWDVYVAASLIHLYCRYGVVGNARRLFDVMPVRDMGSWNAMISGYCQSGNAKEALALSDGLRAMDSVTVLGDIRACGSVLGFTLRKGWFLEDVTIGNAVVVMYAKLGLVDLARAVFNWLPNKDVISWNTIISGYSQNGFASEAMEMYNVMEEEGGEIVPNQGTWVSVLPACAQAGALRQGMKLHGRLLKNGLYLDVFVGTSLADMYGKCGRLEDALSLFYQIPRVNSVPWNTLIACHGFHGHGKKAVMLFRDMLDEGVKPDHITFVTLLSACSHSGLVDEGQWCFDMMQTDYGITPSLKHYGCMVDLFGRAGQLETAFNFIRSMPLQPDASIWGTLLSACRVHGNIDLGKVASEHLFEVDPEHVGYHVLLSNMYATAGKWEGVDTIRSMARGKGLRKTPGWSSMEVNNKVEVFYTGNQTHPMYEEIYRELTALHAKLKMVGYVPDHRFVLQDVEDDEKEHILMRHSERLAIAFALIATPAKTTIQIFKNLRVCGDCHSVTKFISRITEREIIVRDSNRFHHFKDGVCSCGDYW
ncbi:PREDICTED: pentatricopeptide repeat-containing protein At4g33990-like isoform X2 [Camelina sativa]|uniref:Pentatricopeptide repeat-containing protein At4g33990-like isoform X2 n=1 Tax=Camelina sativa TaxID=90675 RepID=A0ABM0TWH1_CAMSA|nr:PREDICTED: pentatricopeptide repeat-containing protein At4g33990-like isoform X2 [Camelina sativa]